MKSVVLVLLWGFYMVLHVFISVIDAVECICTLALIIGLSSLCSCVNRCQFTPLMLSICVELDSWSHRFKSNLLECIVPPR
jgi:hypothetical protein